MKIMYYMPLFLAKKAQATQDEQLLDFCELFKVVSQNASVIDRTETLSTPFTYFNQYPVPQQRKPDADFAQTCIQRAKDILAEGKPTVLMYSGGIDSTCVALAFIYAIKAGIGSFDQVTVAATPVSRIENPEFWSRYILPNFKLESAQDSLAACDLTKRYVQGENADQLFGSDRVMLNAWMLTTEYSRLNLIKWMSSLNLRVSAMQSLSNELHQVALQCPLGVKTMADFMWWINFTFKWQSVSLRTLSFTNVFANGGAVTFDQLKNFETFFNTEQFQLLALSPEFKKWGTVPHPQNYKQEARDFLTAYAEGQDDYCARKIKVGSLYGVITQRSYSASAFGVDDDGLIRATTSLG